MHILFDMRNLFLLLVISLHLVDLVFVLGFHVCTIVTTIVDQFFLHRKVHYVCADAIHEVRGVGCNNEDMVVGG